MEKYTRFVIYGAVLFVLLAIVCSARENLFDAAAYIAFAKNIYLGRPIGNAYHPPLIPYLVAGVYWWTGGVNETYARLVPVAFYMFGLILTVGSLRKELGENKALLAGVLFITMTLPLYHAKHVYTDLPLAVTTLAATIFAYHHLKERGGYNLMLAFIFLIIGCFIKISGLPILAIFTLTIGARKIWTLSGRS